MLGINTKRFDFIPQIAATTVGLSLSTGNLLSTLSPIDLSGWLLLFCICLIPASIFCYHLIFKFEITTRQLIFINCIGIFTFSIITFQFDFIPYSHDEPIITSNWILERKFFIFSLISLLASMVSAYIHAVRVLKDTPYLKTKNIELWHLQLFPESNTHDFWITPKRIWQLLFALTTIGGTILYLAITSMDETHPRFIHFVTTHSIIFLLILILHTLAGITLGESIAVATLEKKLAISPSIYCDMDVRIKWRHDYVKYHLPVPIRKLNLRLFNQHVEAYERLQKQVKSSRT